MKTSVLLLAAVLILQGCAAQMKRWRDEDDKAVGAQTRPRVPGEP